MDNEPIIIVSGLPRSGTSMMMKILDAGGLDVLTDNKRAVDEDNPKGYYELEIVKRLEKSDDNSWLEGARGKVVKIISQLLTCLPDDHNYKIIFMRRKMEEILASQKQMLIRRNEPIGGISDVRLSALFANHLESIDKWLESKSNFEVIYVNYNNFIEDPAMNIQYINKFFCNTLNVEKMVDVVDISLHRQRA